MGVFTIFSIQNVKVMSSYYGVVHHFATLYDLRNSEVIGSHFPSNQNQIHV